MAAGIIQVFKVVQVKKKDGSFDSSFSSFQFSTIALKTRTKPIPVIGPCKTVLSCLFQQFPFQADVHNISEDPKQFSFGVPHFLEGQAFPGVKAFFFLKAELNDPVVLIFQEGPLQFFSVIRMNSSLKESFSGFDKIRIYHMLFRFPHTSLNVKIQLILQNIIFQHAPLDQIHQGLVSAFFQIQFFFPGFFFRFRCHPGMLD